MRKSYLSNGSAWYVKTRRLTGFRGVIVVLALLFVYGLTLYKSPTPAIIPGPHYIPPQQLVVTSAYFHPSYSFVAQPQSDVSLYGLQITVNSFFITNEDSALLLTVHIPSHPTAQEQVVIHQWFVKKPLDLSIEDQLGNTANIWEWRTTHSVEEGNTQNLIISSLFGRVSEYTTSLSLHFYRGDANITFTIPVKLTPISDLDLPSIMKG